MNLKKYIFGVDVGGTTVKIGLFDILGELIEKWEIPTDTTNNGNNILPDISKALENKMSEKSLTKDEFLGIGLGIPGPVDSKSIIHRCVNLGWGVFSIKDCLEELTGMEVEAANDANVAALGEMWKGAGVGKKDIVLITIGTGIGGGIISGEKIVTGVNGSGGEIGHLVADTSEEEFCNCGKQGCVEQYASATGMVKMAKKMYAQGVSTKMKDIENITAKAIVDNAKDGDTLALAVVEKMAEVLAIALSSATALMDPEIIVIGGGVSKAGDIIKDKIQEYYKKYAFHTTKNIEIVIATLGNDAGIYGAARLLL
ncbi:MAG: ROK family glucokinase [Anaerotignaceae bacterium]